MATTKSGFMELRRVRVPGNTVDPGDPITVEADVANTAYTMPIWDKDNVDNNNNPCENVTFGHAYCYEVVVKRPDGSTVSTGPLTIGTTEIGAVNNTVEIKGVEAPSYEGEFTYKAKIVMSGSGMESGWESTTLSVNNKDSEDAKDKPNDGGWLPIGGGDDDNDDDDSDDDSGPDLLKTAMENPVGALIVTGGAGMAIKSIFGGE